MRLLEVVTSLLLRTTRMTDLGTWDGWANVSVLKCGGLELGVINDGPKHDPRFEKTRRIASGIPRIREDGKKREG